MIAQPIDPTKDSLCASRISDDGQAKTILRGINRLARFSVIYAISGLADDLNLSGLYSPPLGAKNR